jgi:hypothetical protein
MPAVHEKVRSAEGATDEAGEVRETTVGRGRCGWCPRETGRLPAPEGASPSGTPEESPEWRDSYIYGITRDTWEGDRLPPAVIR